MPMTGGLMRTNWTLNNAIPIILVFNIFWGGERTSSHRGVNFLCRITTLFFSTHRVMNTNVKAVLFISQVQSFFLS